ncbi:hypothetical protein CMI49_01170 [Candidatus Pacearchaeota archaeon]|jgi:hypothetical protein|nr:hypothetical protein [Candidatus Pacearchaeota archaeon]|tara:strand:+ start:97 stop:663 length:567 start_codon:yes stop_codon:yes gene_type:complete
MKNKTAAMEMSVGIIVTIVLLMTVLILGLVLVRTIFTTSIENIDSIDQAVKGEINKLFAEDDTRKVVIYPPTRKIAIKKGNQEYLGFGFAIRNVGIKEGTFQYRVSVNDPDLRNKCKINAEEAESWIKVGGSGNIDINAGSSMDEPEFVRFLIPENAPPCIIRYGIDVEKDGEQYGSTLSVDLEIEAA